MMTREMVMELLATAGEDLSIYEYSDDSIIAVTVEDFEGFTDDWEEIDRELNDAKLVNYIREQLETKASSVSGDFYRYFHFNDFTVCWGYASFDI